MNDSWSWSIMYTVILDIFGGEFSNARYIIIFVHLLQSFITILELPSAEIENKPLILKGGFSSYVASLLFAR